MTGPGLRVIFLDIDGVMIPKRAFIRDRNAAWTQRIDPACAQVLRYIVEDTAAVIVFNTTHSNVTHPFRDSLGNHPGLLWRFRAFGFRLGREIHRHAVTDYPEIGRLEAIRKWVSEHEVESWIAFDDAVMEDERAFQVHNAHGIGYHEYWHARKWFLGEAPKDILM